MDYNVLCIDRLGVAIHECVINVIKVEENTYLGTVERTGKTVTFWMNDENEEDYVGTTN